MEILNSYANVINFVLLCAIISWLFHISRASRQSIIDRQEALDAANKIREESLTQQLEILRLLKNSNFVSDIKSFREHYEEKSMMLKDKMDSLSEELLETKTLKEQTEKKFEAVLKNLNISENEIANIRNVVKERLLTELSEFQKIFFHELKAPISSMILTPVRIKKAIQNGEIIHAMKMLEDVQAFGNKIKFITDTSYITSLDEIHLNLSEKVSFYSDIILPVFSTFKTYYERTYGVRIIGNFDENSKSTAVKNVDSTLIQLVINELLINASKFTMNKDTDVLVTARLDNSINKLSMVISSNSLEIKEDEVSKIFTARFRSSNATQRHVTGAGLGLSVVKKILDHMGLELAIDSRVNPVAMRIDFNTEG